MHHRNSKRTLGAIRNISDYRKGTFFALKASTVTQIAETTRRVMESCRTSVNGNKASCKTLSEADIRREGIHAILRFVTGMQSFINRLLAQLEEKDKKLTQLERTAEKQEKEMLTLRLALEQHERQHHEASTLAAQHASQAVKYQNLLSTLLDTLSRESWRALPTNGLSGDIHDIATAINTCLTSHQQLIEHAKHHQQSTIQSLATALNEIARGEVPRQDFENTTQTAEANNSIQAAATTLHEIYSGISSIAETIRLSMELLFTIAEEIANDAAYQMNALQKFQETVRCMSQNSHRMAKQTDKTAHIAREMCTLASTLIDEAGMMITAVSESNEKIEGINEIVDQTSLLALNARIIAAQSGEYGRGFAVVAEAMKDLSAQTDTFLQLIGTQTAAITESTDNVHAGVKKIVTSMESAQANIGQVASMASEQSASAQQLAASMEQILSRAKHSARRARKLNEVAQRISIALQQLSDITQFFDPKQTSKFDIYRSVNPAETAAPIRDIASVDELRGKRLAAIFTNRGPADQIGEYRMHAEAERQGLQLKIYSGENSAQVSFRIAEQLLTNGKIDILFVQMTNSSIFQKILHLAEQSQVAVILFGQGANISKEHVPTQVLIQHYGEGAIAAGLAPEESNVYAIFGPADIHCANARAQGFLHNLPSTSRCVGQAHGDWTAREATIIMRNFLHEDGQNACDVIYGVNDTTALGAIGACLEYIMQELLLQHSLTWSGKIVIGTDATEEMLQCIRGREGKAVLGQLLKPIIQTTTQYHEKIELKEDGKGWTLHWGNGHNAKFSIHDGQIRLENQKQTVIIIKDMMTVSHATFYDEEKRQIGVEAMAVRHLVNCVKHPNRSRYVLFSEEQAITSKTPDEIVKAVQYVLTEEHVRWRSKNVLSLGPHNELAPVGEIS